MITEEQTQIIERIKQKNEELNLRATDATDNIRDVEQALLDNGVAIEFWHGNIGLAKYNGEWRLCSNLPERKPMLSDTRLNRIYAADMLLTDFLTELEKKIGYELHESTVIQVGGDYGRRDDTGE